LPLNDQRVTVPNCVLRQHWVKRIYALLVLRHLFSHFYHLPCYAIPMIRTSKQKKKNGCDPTSDVLPVLPPPLTLPLIFFYSPSFLPSKCWNKHDNINSYILKHNAPIEVSSFFYPVFSVFSCWKLSSHYFKPFSVFPCDVLHTRTFCILYRTCQLTMSRQREINVRPFILVSSLLALAEIRLFPIDNFHPSHYFASRTQFSLTSKYRIVLFFF